jgi:hypothetical protein
MSNDVRWPKYDGENNARSAGAQGLLNPSSHATHGKAWKILGAVCVLLLSKESGFLNRSPVEEAENE